MLKKMSGTIRRYRMLERTKSVLVACSGGPDSMALLYGLLRLKNEYGIRLAGFHLNHQLRSKDSSTDEVFVRQVFKKLKIPLVVKSVDVARYAKTHHRSLEEAARIVRYDSLESAAHTLNADRIAIGHTRNDHAETVLLNLIRGSGLAGLSGIPPVRDIPPSRVSHPLRVAIIRPLIETDRYEIMEFLNGSTIPYRLDRSNLDLRFTRNFIRHKILPLILELNPRFLEALSRTTEIITADEKYLAELTALALAATVKATGKNGFFLDIPTLQTYNDSIKRRIIKKLKPDLDFELIQKVIEIMGGPNGTAAALPDGFRAIKESDRLFIGKNRVGTVAGEKKVVFGKTIAYSGWRIKAELKDSCELKNKPDGCEIFDCRMVVLPLCLRTRKPGDRFQPLGLPSKKKLKEVLIDDKIPRRQRETLPLLCDQSGILWILGGRRSERAKISSRTKKFLWVEASKPPEEKN
jgi:tRNA(Ile)-lysidine synthase